MGQGQSVEGVETFAIRSTCHLIFKLLCRISNTVNAVLYHYVIVRSDLPLGTIVAQTIHAAGESSPGPSLPPDTRAVALAAPGEAALLRLEQDLILAGVQFRAIREPDAPYFGQLMAIGLSPVPKARLRGLLAHLQLLK